MRPRLFMGQRFTILHRVITQGLATTRRLHVITRRRRVSMVQAMGLATEAGARFTGLATGAAPVMGAADGADPAATTAAATATDRLHRLRGQDRAMVLAPAGTATLVEIRVMAVRPRAGLRAVTSGKTAISVVAAMGDLAEEIAEQ